MIRWMSVTVALCAAIGCSSGPSETSAAGSPPEAFAGAWRAVTPSLEFIRLSVVSESRQIGVMGVRLGLSGVAWEGSGRIDGDSLVADVAVQGSPPSSSVMIMHARDARTLRLQFRNQTLTSLDLTLVRDD